MFLVAQAQAPGPKEDTYTQLELALTSIPTIALEPPSSPVERSESSTLSQTTLVAQNLSYVQRVLRKTTQDNEPPSKWRAVIIEASQRNGADPTIAVRIARCESGFNPTAQNKTSTASGLFQFLTSTWESQSVKYGITGYKNDPYLQIELATKIMADQGYGRWESSIGCWK